MGPTDAETLVTCERATQFELDECDLSSFSPDGAPVLTDSDRVRQTQTQTDADRRRQTQTQTDSDSYRLRQRQTPSSRSAVSQQSGGRRPRSSRSRGHKRC